jgi:hypothetical protein
MYVIEELAEHLEWCGFGTLATADQDGDIHWGRMPDSPDDCVTVFSTDSGTGGPNATARAQIMVRAKQAKRAYELSYDIAQELEDFNGYLHGNGPGAVIEVINAATGLGADTKKREIYVTNVAIRYCN